ncbi:MAG TPA: hypothetical protein DCP47_00410 [Phycisphaerales bacterium]|nr:hypothetical protein [Phycisphaerales bacterium]
MEKTKQFVFKTNGSALLMTIVLTVMLAAVAVMFVAVARMDRAATSNIADNKNLDTAAMSIIEIINRELICDVPGLAQTYYAGDVNYSEANYPQYYEYKDYPDACDPWLASVEPYELIATGRKKIRWHQISDVTGYLRRNGFSIRDVILPVGLDADNNDFEVVREYPIFGMDANGIFLRGNSQNIAYDGVAADADGDGIADSKWIDISNLRTATGRVFAAIRIIDNSAMVNVNTAYKFDPMSLDVNEIDGTSQMQINLNGLLKNTDDIDDVNEARCNNNADYEQKFIWDFNNFPQNGYLPFDMSDELELRYRFCIDSKYESRFETVLKKTSDSYGTEGGLYDGRSNWGLDDWYSRVTDPCYASNDRRHLLTTYNLDLIIDPNGNNMLNINDANVMQLYNVFRKFCGDANAAQIAVNIKDFRDSDSEVSYLPVDGNNYFGFETPCVYISELVYRQVGTGASAKRSYAIELFKPYEKDISPDANWRVDIYDSSGGKTYSTVINGWTDSSQYFVIKAADAAAPLNEESGCPTMLLDPSLFFFEEGYEMELLRQVNGSRIVVDRIKVPTGLVPSDNEGIRNVERDNTLHNCIARIRGNVDLSGTHTLGKLNGFAATGALPIQAHPKNRNFTNIGEIGMVFKRPAYFEHSKGYTGVIGYDAEYKTESAVRLNLADANLSPVFNYLTALRMPNTSQTKVKGRININTAPASVIAQLPWIVDANLAQSIVKYRDNDVNGFTSIRQLVEVNDMDYYTKHTMIGDQLGFPDLTPGGATGDGAGDDFEERDLIFARVSDLVTVRSDVFTAYILVRIGTDGPQKRYIAILDRSQVRKPSDKVIIRAFQQVPDAR